MTAVCLLGTRRLAGSDLQEIEGTLLYRRGGSDDLVRIPRDLDTISH